MEGFSYIAVCQTAEGFGKRSVFPTGIRRRHGSLLTNQPKGLLLRSASISAEENWAFQGLPPERISLFFCSNKSKS